MGCFAIQLACGDAFINNCWHCIAPRFLYIRKLQENLQRLTDERDRLRAVKARVQQRVNNEEGLQMRQAGDVRVWVSMVERALVEVESLITEGQGQTNKLCFGGYFSTTCFSTYSSAKKIAKMLPHVISLREKGNFAVVVERILVEPECLCQLENDVNALRDSTKELQALKDDVMRKINEEEGPEMTTLERVRLWILNVNTRIPQFEALIIDGEDEIQRWRGGNLTSSTVGERVAKGLNDVIALKQSGHFERVVGRAPLQLVIERPIEPTIGHETLMERVWNSLLEEGLGVIGIYGMGGVGKTTLLTEINNKFANSLHDFDFVIQVKVSRDLDLEILQGKIAERIGLPNTERWMTKTVVDKATIIFNLLKEKKLVLLLDDVWGRVELIDIGIPLRSDKCKIVFTTRSEEVCSVMEARTRIKVEPLEWQEAWQLFQEKVGREALGAHPNIPCVAEDVARECAGLPLALIIVGRTMSCKSTIQEWKYALQILSTHASSFQGVIEDVFRILRFSYDNLSNKKFQSCLLYCTLFPEGFEITKEELIEKWICEDFWDNGNNKADPINEGYHILGTLVRLCLLEDKDGGNVVKMHDMIRDMCLWIACDVEKEKENYFVQAATRLTKAPQVEKWREVRRISLMQNRIQQLTQVPTSPRLLTLLLCRNPELKWISDGFFQVMKVLTVLDLSITGLRVFPIEITELVALQYLDISYTKIETLPEEMMKLNKLKYLSLEFTRDLKEIPREMIASFQLLQVLKLYGCGFVVDKSTVGELAGLEDLRVLSITVRDGIVLEDLLCSHPSLRLYTTRILASRSRNYSFNYSRP